MVRVEGLGFRDDKSTQSFGCFCSAWRTVMTPQNQLFLRNADVIPDDEDSNAAQFGYNMARRGYKCIR